MTRNQAHQDDDWPLVTVRGFIVMLAAAIVLIVFAYVFSVAFLLIGAPAPK